MNIAPPGETGWYRDYWNHQRDLFVFLVCALILSNLAVAAAVAWLAHVLKTK